MERSNVCKWALELGFSQLGVCSINGFEAQKKAVDAQPALNERRQLRFFPQEDCPWARSLLVLLWGYAPSVCPQSAEHVFVDSYYYASNQAYHAAKSLEQRLLQAGYRAQANVSYPAREAAARAGLGVIGDNGLLITPQHGTRVVIILMATDAVDIDEPDQTRRTECLHCGRCRAACPTGALGAGGMEHPERCLRNFMMEGIVVPENTRQKMGRSLIGCDTCQRVCPMQPKVLSYEDEQFVLDDFLSADDAQFKEAVSRLGGQIGRNAARPQRVRAQAALLAGNRGNPADLPVLRAWAQSDFEAVRVHARWAVAKIEARAQGLDQSGETR